MIKKIIGIVGDSGVGKTAVTRELAYTLGKCRIISGDYIRAQIFKNIKISLKNYLLMLNLIVELFLIIQTNPKVGMIL